MHPGSETVDSVFAEHDSDDSISATSDSDISSSLLGSAGGSKIISHSEDMETSILGYDMVLSFPC